MMSDTYSVLVVTKDSKTVSLISSMLIPPLFELTVSQDFNEARRICGERNFNIIIIDFAEGEGTDFALDISSGIGTILLLSPVQYFDQISYKVESFGILTITAPFDQFYFYNMIKIAIAVQYKTQLISSQTIKLKEKMEEIRLVNKAKMLLMQHESMTEDQAHHHLEKTAMDNGLKRIAVAENVIRKYENS